jgi:hypothetical protein
MGAQLMPFFPSFIGRHLWEGGGCGAPVPTPLVCPILLSCSFPPPRALLSFQTCGLFVSQTAQHLRPGSRREHFFRALGLEILFLFFLALKTGEVQVGVDRVSPRMDFRILLGNYSSTVLLSLLLLLLLLLACLVLLFIKLLLS